MGDFNMNRIAEKVEELKEIHVDNMHFRVISKHPQYATDKTNQLQREMRRELYTVFKRYV